MSVPIQLALLTQTLLLIILLRNSDPVCDFITHRNMESVTFLNGQRCTSGSVQTVTYHPFLHIV